MHTFSGKLALPILVAFAQMANAKTLMLYGMTAMQLEDWDKAISIYSALAKANPTDQVALLTLANAYLAKGEGSNLKKVLMPHSTPSLKAPTRS